MANSNDRKNKQGSGPETPKIFQYEAPQVFPSRLDEEALEEEFEEELYEAQAAEIPVSELKNVDMRSWSRIKNDSHAEQWVDALKQLSGFEHTSILTSLTYAGSTFKEVTVETEGNQETETSCTSLAITVPLDEAPEENLKLLLGKSDAGLNVSVTKQSFTPAACKRALETTVALLKVQRAEGIEKFCTQYNQLRASNIENPELLLQSQIAALQHLPYGLVYLPEFDDFEGNPEAAKAYYTACFKSFADGKVVFHLTDNSAEIAKQLYNKLFTSGKDFLDSVTDQTIFQREEVEQPAADEVLREEAAEIELFVAHSY